MMVFGRFSSTNISQDDNTQQKIAKWNSFMWGSIFTHFFSSHTLGLFDSVSVLLLYFLSHSPSIDCLRLVHSTFYVENCTLQKHLSLTRKRTLQHAHIYTHAHTQSTDKCVHLSLVLTISFSLSLFHSLCMEERKVLNGKCVHFMCLLAAQIVCCRVSNIWPNK